MKRLKQRRGVFRAFWPYVRPYTWKIGLALVILILDTLADLAAPWPIKLIFDNRPLAKMFDDERPYLSCRRDPVCPSS